MGLQSMIQAPNLTQKAQRRLVGGIRLRQIAADVDDCILPSLVDLRIDGSFGFRGFALGMFRV